MSDLQLGEFIYEQPAFPDVEYTFKHALTQEVAYNSVLVERRQLLHERAGQALEAMFAEQLDDHLSELANHYSRSDNVAKAVEYLRLAAEQAVEQSAYSEAAADLKAAIAIVGGLPEGPDRLGSSLRCISPRARLPRCYMESVRTSGSVPSSGCARLVSGSGTRLRCFAGRSFFRLFILRGESLYAPGKYAAGISSWLSSLVW